MTQPRDNLYSNRRTDLVDFAFDEAVVDVFSDMIRRSVPGYDTVISLSGLMAGRAISPGSRCFDLGCSLGASTLAVLHQLDDRDCELVAVDNSAAMLERAEAARDWDPRVTFSCADIREQAIDNASAVLMNYTLQFVPAEERLDLLKRIYAGLRPGGILIVSEKVVADQATEQLHLDFKRANGYSELEIAQKRQAIENVMVPDTIDTHLERFADAGFGQVNTWFRCLNWASFVATR